MAEEVIIVETTFHPVTWGSFVLRGLVALLIGIPVLIWTNTATEVVVTLIGILIISAAILVLVLALSSRAGDSLSVELLLVGILGLILGAAAILYPLIAAAALTALIAVMMIFFGFIDLSIAIFHPEYTRHRLVLGFSAALSVLLGGIFFFLPSLGAFVLIAVYLGLFAVIYGLMSIAIGITVRSEQKRAMA